jgi:hypothetical protein
MVCPVRFVLIASLVLVAVACGGGSKPSGGSASPTAVVATATPSAAASAADAAVAAAVALTGGVVVPDGPTCQKQTKPCVLHGVDPESPDRGVAVVEVGDPAGGAAMVVFGRQSNGAWGFWFGTQQQVYHALVLPAQMRVCADGEGVNLRQGPDTATPSISLLKDGTMVTVDSFVLTQPGSYGKPGPTGNGWYAVSAPASGYVRADFLSVTTLPDCSLRDALVKSAAP